MKKYLTEEQYEKSMIQLGFVKDNDFGKFFLGGSAFLGNVSDDVNDIYDLISFNNNGYMTYMAKTLDDLMNDGAYLVIGTGAIDEYGERCKKGLYCTNYRILYSKNENKKMVLNKRI